MRERDDADPGAEADPRAEPPDVVDAVGDFVQAVADFVADLVDRSEDEPGADD